MGGNNKMLVRLLYLPYRLNFEQFTEGDQHPLIAEVQKLLAGHDLYRSESTGYYDANTVEAVSSFQDANHLPITGTVDPVTFCRLHRAHLIELAPVARSPVNPILPRANILVAKTSRQITLFDGNALSASIRWPSASHQLPRPKATL